MTTIHETIPRKKLATYGKAGRRRVPQQHFTSIAAEPELRTLEEPVESQKSISPPADPPLQVSAAPKRLKSAPPPTRLQSPTPPPDADIYDVPTSDGEVVKPRKPKKRPLKLDQYQTKQVVSTTIESVNLPIQEETVNKVTIKPKSQISKPVPNAISKITTANSIPATNGTEQRKRLKLSPPSKSREIQLPINTKARPAKSLVNTRTTKRTSPPEKAKAGISKTRMPGSTVARLLVKTPEPKSWSLSPSPPQNLSDDVEMLDVAPIARHISPKGMRMWKGLLGEDESEMETESTTAKVVAQSTAPERKPAIQSLARPLFKSASISKPSQNGNSNLVRKRLIDSLVQQANDSDTENDSDDSTEPASVKAFFDDRSDQPSSQNLTPEVLNSIISASQSSQVPGPKHVYGRERTILAEKDFMEELELDMPPVYQTNSRRARRGSIPVLPVLASFHEVDEVEDEVSTTAIRSVHELRQAGANNRFMDEIEDFIERIGSPNGTQVSMRRSGLLDLASKMKDKDFIRQFRANGVEQRLFVHLGQETDVISGSVLASLLTSILAEGSIPHIIPQLRRQGITRLLIRLLDNQLSIKTISKDRKNNMSKIAQSFVAEYQDHLLQMPIWEELQPLMITPRTIALKCLEKMVRQTREAGNSGDIFSKELTTNLFQILSTSSDESSWDLPTGKAAIDFYLALSALESHSIIARTAQDETIWISNFLPIVSDALQVALSRPVDDFGDIQLLVLRLALNVTNNNPKGADVFARPALLSIMGQVIVAKFKRISRFLREEEFCVVMDHLVLVLGVMINFAEWSPAAREGFQSLDGRSDDTLERMAQLFADNQERMAEADSVEESQKNVAFGYLSVLLGYFALLPAMSKRIQKRLPRGTTRSLVASIQEFIGHHKTVDDLIGTDPDGHNPQSGLTERLEALVRKLDS